MGFLFQDIINDDAHNRSLAGSGEQIVIKYNVLKQNPPQNNYQYLFQSRKLRDFLIKEMSLIEQKIGKHAIISTYDNSSNASQTDIDAENSNAIIKFCIELEKEQGPMNTIECLAQAGHVKNKKTKFSKTILYMCSRLIGYDNNDALDCMLFTVTRNVGVDVPFDFVKRYIDSHIWMLNNTKFKNYGNETTRTNILSILNKKDFSNYKSIIENCKAAETSKTITIFSKCVQ